MSYCRWSSMDWKCDLYCYEDVSGGFTTHVAGSRRVGDIPHLEWDVLSDGYGSSSAEEQKRRAEEFMQQYHAQMASLDKCELVPIGLPHDGETFNDGDLESFKARLLSLRADGYIFPDHVLEEIDAELAEEKKQE